MTILAPAMHPYYIPLPTELAFWPMDDHAANAAIKDLTGAREGTFLDAGGNPNTNAHSVAGRVDTTLDFDGNDDYGRWPKNIFANADFAAGMTLSFWTFSTEEGRTQHLLNFENRVFVWKYTNNLIYFTINDGATKQCTSIDAIPKNTWIHVACTWNTDLMTVHINGAAKGTNNATGLLLDAADEYFTIGAAYNGTSPLKGRIDDVRFFGVALNTIQVLSLYNHGVGRH